MKFTNTFLLIALLAISYTNTFEFASLEELSDIKSTSYGKSLLETISLSLSQKGNVGEIQKLLRDLLFKLNKDQARDTRRWKREKRRLTRKIIKLTRKIRRIGRKILRLLAKKAKYIRLRNRARKNLIQYKKQKSHDRKALKNNRKRRAKDHREFKKSQAQHMDVINALNAVLKELRKVVGSVAGKGKPKHVRMNAEEKRDLRHRLKKSFLQITKDEVEVESFVQVATEADQRALAKLIHFIKKIKRSTKRSYNNDLIHERRSKSAFKRLRRVLKKDVKRLMSLIRHQVKNLKLYIRIIKQTIAKIIAQRKLRRAFIAEKKAAIKERRIKKAKYLADKKQRDEERRVIKRIMLIVRRRLANMSKWLKNRI